VAGSSGLIPAAAAAAAAAAGAGSLTGAAASGPRVLLLLVSQGGLGLNLTEAQHVVLLEPLLDPALDVQAIGRVSRFGQTRDTHVHR
jgi:SNF2 family DNA or RNA helicase